MPIFGPTLTIGCGFKGVHVTGYGRVELTVTVTNYRTNEPLIVSIRPVVIDTDFELILGLHTIAKHKLLECIWSELNEVGTEGVAEYQRGRSERRNGPIESFLTALHDKDDVFTYLDDNDDIIYNDEIAYGSNIPEAEDDPLTNIDAHIIGSPELKADIIKLCQEFKEIFCRHVKPEPAKIRAMKLTVDTLKMGAKNESWSSADHVCYETIGRLKNKLIRCCRWA